MSATARSLRRNGSDPHPVRVGRSSAAVAVDQSPRVVPGPIGEPAARLLAVGGIAAIAVIHILDAPGAFDGARYIFWLYMAIVVGAVPIALVMLHWSSPLAWLGTAALAAGPLVGYLLTRSVGLPGDSGDIGNWLTSLGIASMFAEAGVLSLALTRLGLAWRAHQGTTATLGA